MVLHHRRGQFWKTWNPEMRDYLIEQQVLDGHEAGSWHFDDQAGAGKQGGRLCSAVMAAMTLEGLLSLPAAVRLRTNERRGRGFNSIERFPTKKGFEPSFLMINNK